MSYLNEFGETNKILILKTPDSINEFVRYVRGVIINSEAAIAIVKEIFTYLSPSCNEYYLVDPCDIVDNVSQQTHLPYHGDNLETSDKELLYDYALWMYNDINEIIRAMVEQKVAELRHYFSLDYMNEHQMIIFLKGSAV